MKIKFFLSIGFLFFLGGNAALGGDLLDEESRWKYVLESNDIGSVHSFLLNYPNSVHVKQAREMLALYPKQPLGKLTTDTPVCRDALSTRSASQVSWYKKNEKYGMYDFIIPENHFVSAPTLEIVPRGSSADKVLLENKFMIDLIATKTGGCAIYLRWSSGSGLPAECKCEPVDKNFEFESDLANGILTDYSRMHAGNDVCKSHNKDYSAEIEKYLAEVIRLKKARADSIRKLKETGKFVLPTEVGEMEDIYFALPRIEKKTMQRTAYEKTKSELELRELDKLGNFCERQLPKDISEARSRLKADSMKVQ